MNLISYDCKLLRKQKMIQCSLIVMLSGYKLNFLKMIFLQSCQ